MTASRRRPFIAGNWKMHLTVPEARALVSDILRSAPGPDEVELLVIPPFTALTEVAKLLPGTGIGLGAQDLYWEEQGAFTGEVSGAMLRDAGCSHVLVGHSERRQLFGENEETVLRKARAALKAGLKPIVCIGETLEERRAGGTIARLDRQFDAGLGGFTAEEMASVVLAYEPVWAIGTGLTATPAQAGEAHAHIRRRYEEKYGNALASCAIILYGGSVKTANSFELFREKNIDGFLVGGASLEADSFVGIAREALRADREVK
jgi:triosephosphate isomerase (TIM)